jgi:hypothetical protein
MTIKFFANGYTSFERVAHNGYYIVKVYVGEELHDKIMCDTYKSAKEYLRAFNAIARNA